MSIPFEQLRHAVYWKPISLVLETDNAVSEEVITLTSLAVAENGSTHPGASIVQS